MHFSRKRELDGEIVLVYESTRATLPQNYYFKVVDIIPPYAGCDHCIFKGLTEDGKYVCKFQNNKILKKEVKNCSLFRQKRVLKV